MSRRERDGAGPSGKISNANMPWPENNKANDILTQNVYSTVVAVQCGLPRGRQLRAELMHCLACATLSEAQGSGESREACITPSEVDKVHQWPIYSTVQYRASSPPANTQWQHEQVCVSFMPIKTKLACSIKNFLSWEVREMVPSTPSPIDSPTVLT